jgi:hypothetical protein
MKKLHLLITCLAVTATVQAQINVRVKNSGNSKEIDIKTGGSSSKNKDTETKPATPDSKPQQTPGTSAGSSSMPKTDTASKPLVMNWDAGYNGPAKSMVTSFYKQAEGVKEAIENGKKYGAFNTAIGKLGMMESNLKKIKEKDPNYSNIAKLEEIYNNLKSETESNQKLANDKVASGRDEAANKTKNERLLETVIDGTGMQVGSNNLPFMDQAMKDFKAKADEVLKLDLSKYKIKLDDLKMYVHKSHTLAADRVMEKANVVIKELSEPENFEPIHKELQFRQLYWDVVRKVYSGDATCEKYYKLLSDMLAKIGSPDDIKKTAVKNNAEAIKNRKLPPALQKDAALEKALIDGFNAKYKESYKGTAIKVIILQPEWYIERNDLTGVVTGRNKHCALVYKDAAGKCYLMSQLVYAYQDYVGGSFGKTQIVYKGLGGEEMLCENVK